MTSDHSSESEGRQLTVAELLKQHGGEGRGGSRRRRRTEDKTEPPDTAAGSESSAPPAQRSDGLPRRVPGGGGFPASERDGQVPPPSVSTGSTPVVPNYSTQPYGDQAYDDQPYPDQPYGDRSYRDSDDAGGTGGFESYGSDRSTGWSGPSGSFGATGTGGMPPVNGRQPDGFSFDAYTDTGGFEAQPHQGDIYGAGSGTDELTGRKPEESTDFIPRLGSSSTTSGLPAVPRSQRTGPLPAVERGTATGAGAGKAATGAGPGTEFSEPVDLFDDDDDVPSSTVALGAAGKGAAGKLTDTADRATGRMAVDDESADDEDEKPRSRRSRRLSRRKDADADVPAGLSAEDAVDDQERPTGLKVWLSLAGQLVLGAVGGAGLWIAFSFLWQRFPVVALIAAVAATAGLVMLVRAIRRSDDLQTTMLAVLVGLVVTISPAVLLLAVR